MAIDSANSPADPDGSQATPDAASPPPASKPRYERAWRRVLKKLGADPDEVVSPSDGRSPTTLQMFLWDLAPANVAPNADGMELPHWDAPEWLVALNDSQVEQALEVQRRETARRRESISATELKASRLLTPFVALLTGAVALTAFQLNAIDRGSLLVSLAPTIGAFFGLAGSAFLVVGLSRALDADTRMSRSTFPTTQQEVSDRRTALINEAQASATAQFVQRNKANRILHARSAISRALLCLVVSALCAALWLVTKPAHPSSGRDQTPIPQRAVTTTPAPLKRPGSDGGSQSMEDESRGSTQEVLRRTA